ncbi:hypothetical protein A3I34_02045 [Candidatus Jorgensenbacteria bacterium RIFCSPLOWO2_02_FULL_45_12]|nr:MAG: hypothetical protein A3I34_02045 [Candidatus Jorgensenbacteria bacterium RIFCSPLOWO2_02_FULL_45_12]
MEKIKEKKERSLGANLFVKATRCNSPKCAFARRPSRPGPHGQKRRRPVSEFGRQMQEKQKLRFTYGLTDKQLMNLFGKNKNKVEIMKTLEHRLDRVVFLLGFALSPRVARQYVSHGHILVDGRKVTVSSFRVRVKNEVSIRPESLKLKIFEDIRERLKSVSPPPWLKIRNIEEPMGECVGEFSPEGSQFSFDVNLVGEFYAR